MKKKNCNIEKDYDMEQFKTAYQAAYNRIEPDKYAINRIEEALEDKRMRTIHTVMNRVMRPVVTVCVLVLILSVTVLPVAAKSIPLVYSIIEQYVPQMADFVLPEEVSDTSAGITMQVEAINVEEQNAEILVSFSDAEGSDRDLIKGKVDLYDSYHLRSFGASCNVGGCSFLAYDQETDKAYFKISVSTDGVYGKGKLQFSVHQVLMDLGEEEKKIDLENVERNPGLKYESLNGKSGSMEEQAVLDKYKGSSTEEDPRPCDGVLDLPRPEGMADALTVTGVAYIDGILRVQSCRGNLSEADRHMEPFIVDRIDGNGNERHSDFHIGWQETVNGETLSFDEHWFLVEESELEQTQLYGIFYVTDGSVKGDWKVTFRVEE